MAHWNRRDLLRAGAAGLLAAPFLGSLLPQVARANGVAKRLVVFFSPNGTVHSRWRPTGSGTNFSFGAGTILEPLAGLEDQLIVMDGINFHQADNHEGGMGAMLTNNGGEGTETSNLSLDQFVASRIGNGTKFRSLELGVQTSAWGGNVQTRMSYAGAGHYVTPDDRPESVFDRMFGDLLLADTERQRMTDRRSRILDSARTDLVDLHRRLGYDEKLKLERHIQALDDLEVGLFAGTTCEPGTPPTFVDPMANDNFPTVARQQIDLLVQSLACGMTNVASLQLSHTVGPVVMSWLGVGEGHHTLSHIDNSNQHGIDQFVLCERWFAEQFAYLVSQLQMTPDPVSGGTLLDDTIVLWAKELGDGRMHQCVDVPWVIAGSGGGRLRTGQYLSLNGTHHSHILTTICQAFGLTNTTFGNPAAGTGDVGALWA